MNITPLSTRLAITPATRKSEKVCVDALLALWQEGAPNEEGIASIQAHAATIVSAIRKANKGASGVDHLMQEFSLSSSEGVALMCLAEALLRIPDTATMDKLIRDKIGKGDWKAHIGNSESLFVNAAAWGLMITGHLVSSYSERTLSQAINKMLATGGEPLIRKGVEYTMGLLGKQFVMGETIEAALQVSNKNLAKGYTHSFDMLGEAALTMDDAKQYYSAYENAIHAIGSAAQAIIVAPAKNGLSGNIMARNGISVKLSALHPRYTLSQYKRVMDELYPRLLSLATLSKGYDIGLNIDAEESERLELSLDLIDRLAQEPSLQGWDGLGVVVQAYQKRAPFVIQHLAYLAKQSHRKIMVRLVKGAYWDSEIRRAQIEGLSDYPVFTRKHHTDVSYLACAKLMLGFSDVIYPQFATHNAHSFATIAHIARAMGVENYEFQCLHGMGENLYDQVVGQKTRSESLQSERVRIYAPVGKHQALLPYLVRRLLENGANSSFVNRIVDEKVSINALIADPIARTIAEGGHLHDAIPLPPMLYGPSRKNASACDLSNSDVVNEWQESLHRYASLGADSRVATPIVVGLPINPTTNDREVVNINNPANRSEAIGRAIYANANDAKMALNNAESAVEAWGQTPAKIRADILRKAADLLEGARGEVIYLCTHEAGKSWVNAMAEWREAVDFLRYYANSAEGLLQSQAPMGIAVCIAPWNFPLAIFLGEVSAALASGYVVVAKSAEQTPLIAHLGVKILHEAGVPPNVLQYLPGRGEVVGNVLTADPRVKAVIFTGSTEVAKIINNNIATHAGQGEVKFIAETGGQNVMVVDSSAHTEQVVQDVLASAFDSAGQRCSALRVLCLQDDVADKILTMLKNAMQELTIGNPAHFSTDIGPVIDEEARQNLTTHINAMREKGHEVELARLPAECEKGTFVALTLIHINSLADLSREVFGPIVHILRFRAKEMDRLIADINQTGYGLTFGAHSRIDEHIEKLAATIHVGNIYINRNMVGAVVGAQPFGGCGLSGTGPKAGGPLYVPHLAGVAMPDMGVLGGKRKIDDPANINLSTALSALTLWASSTGNLPLSLSLAEYSAATPIAYEIALPGPTGEINTLSFERKGGVMCIADSQEALWAQIAAILATGNTPVILHSKKNQLAISALPQAVQNTVQWIVSNDNASPAVAIHSLSKSIWATISAVLLDNPALRAEVAKVLAKMEDTPIIPLITPINVHATNTLYPLYRLMHEKCVCINTTAAGGNASLMTMGE